MNLYEFLQEIIEDNQQALKERKVEHYDRIMITPEGIELNALPLTGDKILYNK